ncbi:MAG: hypothetical protein ONB33_08865 [candidate division KSB1 bacterium]|nr:hypothetical protein [candidate division KSB1 bacterium]
MKSLRKKRKQYIRDASDQNGGGGSSVRPWDREGGSGDDGLLS